MGRKTFESLPHPLANRTHLVITHQDILNPEIKTFHSKEEIDAYLNNLDEEVFVIGGSLIYQMFIKEAEKIFLTEINDTKKADAYFPYFNKNEFIKNTLFRNEEQNISYTINEYVRKKRK